MRKRLKGIIAALIIILIAFSVLGCGINRNIGDNNNEIEGPNNDEGIDDEPVYGGELTVPISDVKTLNPLFNEDRDLYYFNKLIYEGLFEFDENLDIKNVLAEDYSIMNNGQVVKIKLRDNILWHDGQKLTSSDVKFTIDLIKHSAQDSIYREMMSTVFKPGKPSDLEHILDVKIIDENNLEIHFDRSYSNALESLIFPILPRHQFAENNVVNKTTFEKIPNMKEFTPIGTGPYKFVEYQKLKSIELTVNENWWKGKAYISKITGKILRDDKVAITAFESGQIDLSPTFEIDWEKYAQKEKVKMYEYISQIYEFLGFNFSKEIFLGERGKALRKAIAYGIDRQSIIKKIYLGHATQTDVPIPPNSWLVSEDSMMYGYNPDKSKEILESAGWTDEDGDGIYEDAEGKELEIRLLTNSYNKLRKQTADIIIDNLKNIGIKVIPMYPNKEPENITEEMIITQWEEVQQKINSKDFDIVLSGWELSYIPDLSFAFHSSQIEYGTNFISYSNEKMDELLVKAFRAPTREEKKETFKELQSLILDELPYVSLFFRNTSILVDKRIRGEINPQSYNIYNEIDKWYIPEVYQNKQNSKEE